MSNFFGTSSSGSGANSNKSSSSGSGGGGWGTFLKQGLSTIESKLDTVLDINVPIPGGSSGILTSFSPHASVLPSSDTPKDTPPKRKPPHQVPSTSHDDSLHQEEDTRTQDSVVDLSKNDPKRSSISIKNPTIKNKDSERDLRKSANATSIRGSMDEEASGMITTIPGVKRMMTPPVSGTGVGTTTPSASASSALSATAATAAANRERLEQRMRGIFKKSAESPSTTPTPSMAAARSPAGSSSPSVRHSTSLEPEIQSQENEGAGRGDESVEKDTKPIVAEIVVAKTSQEEIRQELKETVLAPPDSDSAKEPENCDSLQDLKNNGDGEKVEPANHLHPDSIQEPEIESTDQVNKSTVMHEDVSPSEPLVEAVESNINRTSLEEPETTAKEELEPELEQDDRKSDNVIELDRVDNAPDLASLDNQQIATTLSETPIECPYTPTSNTEPQLVSAVQDDSIVTVQISGQDDIASKVDSKEDASVSHENPLKKVLEQREEQLLKVMQEQSSLLEKLRDLEDAKAADETLKNTKISGLEMIIETQKKELEAARGSNLTSQPKSIQKTLEEQRALLEDKDEQIRGLLAEGEVLSKKEFKNLTAIKALRTKNIEAEKLQMGTQKKLDRAVSDYADAQAKLSKLSDENKQLNDAIKSLHDINQRQNKQMSKMEAELVQLRDDKANLQLGVDRLKQELSEARKVSAELSNQAHAAALEREVKLNEDLNNEIDALKAQHTAVESNLRQDIQELRVSLSNREELAGEKEDQLLMEIRNLQARLEQTDNDSYELQEVLDEARRPLLRQIEVLQNQQGIASRNWDRVEKSLTRRVAEAEEEMAKAQERERAARDKLDEMKSQSTSHEARLEALRVADTQLRAEVNAAKRALKEKEEETRQAQAELARERVNRERAIEEAKDDAERKLRLQQQTEIDKLKQQIQQLQQRQGASDNQSEIHLSTVDSMMRRSSSTGTSSSSPLLSGGPLVMGGPKAATQISNLSAGFDSITSPTSLDGMSPILSRSNSSQTMSGTGAASMGLMGLGSGATGQAVAIERLNTMVRQLEGQVTFLSEQVRTANKNKDELSDELVRVTVELEELQTQASRAPSLEQELTLLQERHKAALEMLGERTEEVQELKADLADVKEALRDQISELLSQLEQSRRANKQ
ncbi:hypothetical protein BGZ80_003112 [Entomortierella chlamydospora]|uniref:TATA element modulatory factor 1 TATA binding domain-containing protein n=1 Tax=Entomortierella chlamydospora TaxID=101097 RepID=A0A9P6SWV9_9FUNG|nr:hypothetical protein BGZ79_002472 [Entomortierella chlamydospora]KAG0008743.1 hypothetical protein BGZ80_003112 [Entomortierella chlamydospora]